MERKNVNKIINKYRTKHKSTEWYLYYREKLKQYINDYYSVDDLTANAVCYISIPTDCYVDIFAIWVNNNTIYMLLWNKTINVSNLILYLM